MMEFAVEISDLTVKYKDKPVLDGLSLKVKRGEIFGFIGPNGAGKTTTIKAILALLHPSKGTVLLNGLAPQNRLARQKTGYLPEEAAYYRFLTPTEVLFFYGKICGIPRSILKKKVDELLELTGLSPYAKKRVGTLSKGTVQKLGLAQCLVNDPETLILDEPTSGFDPLARLGLRNILLDLKKKGRTIFFSSHELSEVELICDSMAIVKDGRALRSGSLKEVVGPGGDKNLELFFLETMRTA